MFHLQISTLILEGMDNRQPPHMGYICLSTAPKLSVQTCISPHQDVVAPRHLLPVSPQSLASAQHTPAELPPAPSAAWTVEVSGRGCAKQQRWLLINPAEAPSGLELVDSPAVPPPAPLTVRTDAFHDLLTILRWPGVAPDAVHAEP